MKVTGPIPGENFTSDTKNYPWHRPPQYTSLDDAIDGAAKQLLSEDASDGMVILLQAGMDIATLTDMYVTSGIMSGKWTPDFAILIAGPISHIIYLMAKAYDIECDLGIDLPKESRTKAYFDAVKMDKKKVDDIINVIDSMGEELPQVIEQKATGFMAGMPQAPQEQAAIATGIMGSLNQAGAMPNALPTTPEEGM